MNHKEKLMEIYNRSFLIEDIVDVPKKYIEYVKIIANKSYNQKGVFTVLLTLLIHKLIDSKQDIRFHQSNLKNGFSGRSIDTKYITPTLKALKLPSMAESGWLTRSLEQPYPYNLSYNGKISNIQVKEASLNIIDFVQTKKGDSYEITRLLFYYVLKKKKEFEIIINPLKDSDKLTISDIVNCLTEFFTYNYGVFGASKLPVLSFYSIFQILVDELFRYKNCQLKELGSHTASDKTSQSCGDIEINKKKKLFEAIEIKLNKPIDMIMVRIAIEKVIKFNPKRYYIFSLLDVKKDEKEEIEKSIYAFKLKHGCQIILNGTIPTLKYYLRLISSLKLFIEIFSKKIETDLEIKKEHKEKWNILVSKYFS